MSRGDGRRERPPLRVARPAAGAVVAVLLLVLTAAGCTSGSEASAPSPGPARPVTVAESELLAGVRSGNVEAGSRAITAEYDEQGHEVRLEGWVDYTTRTGYGLVSTDGRATDRVMWDGRLVAMTDGDRLGKPLRSLDGWAAAPLDPSTSPLSAVLAVLAGLGADRPEDPRLVRQGGALWLRADEAAGHEVQVFAGPTSAPAKAGGSEGGSAGDVAPVDPDDAGIRYWVGDDGLAHRVDVRLGDEWAEVTLENDDVKVPPLLADIDLDEQRRS
ncbi:hypothetical protein GCM10028784_15150 [Myceligenerans cantabricum]